MNRVNAPFLFLILGVASTACSALTDFDRGKIIKKPEGAVKGDGATGTDDDAGPDGMDGDVVDPGGCEPGTAGEACEPCEPGQYCAGGSTPAVDCPESEWDHDLNPATSCVLQRDCSPGEFVSAMGTTTSDRVCAPCASGRYSAQPNSPLCDGWTTCEVGEYVKQAGTTGSDQLCEACAEGEYSDAPNSGRCVPIGDCAAGSKKAASGQPGQCLSCSIGEYCAGGDEPPVVCAEGTWDHDASPASPCVEWTACGPGMAMSMAGSPTGNRVCTDCPSGTFSADANAATCTPWSNCEAGTFVSMTGGPAADRVCSPCAEGTFSAAPNANACTPHATCGAGTFVGAAGTASIDRVCTPCPAGEFNTADNARACTPWTTCRPGAYVSRTGTASRNQTCTDCASGFYSAVENAGECTRRESCAAGQRQVRPGTATTNPTCAACDPGQYCAGGAAPPVACGEGTWDHDRNPGTQCVDWTACQPGTYVSRPGSATVNRACSACPERSFSSEMNAAQCSPWRTCLAGTRVSTPGSATANRACADCTDGTFTAGMNESVCAPHRICGAGTYVTTPAPSTTNNRTCAPCPSGQFSTEANVTTCSPWRVCQPGNYVLAEGQTSANRVCAPCPPRTDSTIENAPACFGEQCQAGTEQITPPAEMMPATCRTCEAGEYCPGGAQQGEPCPDGYWDDDGRPGTRCVLWTRCGEGQYSSTTPSATIDRNCADCPDGTFSETANSARCEAWRECTPNVQYETSGGSRTSDRTCENLQICQAGSYQVTAPTPTSDRDCMPCPPGTVSRAENLRECTDCSIGHIPNAERRECVRCDDGEFNPVPGGAACIPHDMSCGPDRTLYGAGTHERNILCYCSPGHYATMLGDAINHPMCAECTAGFTSAPNVAMACTPFTMCGPGQELASEGDATRNNECASCPTGTANPDAVNVSMCPACTGDTYSPNVGATMCLPRTICSTSQYVVTNGTPSTNRVCAPCPNGGTTPAPNSPMEACMVPAAPDAGM